MSLLCLFVHQMVGAYLGLEWLLCQCSIVLVVHCFFCSSQGWCLLGFLVVVDIDGTRSENALRLPFPVCIHMLVKYVCAGRCDSYALPVCCGQG